jgi:WD40 repeat protein/serine/threonine protein kinase
MTATTPDLNEIFSAAIDCESSQARQQYLDAACGGDASVRARLEALLQAHSLAGGFFGGKSAAIAATAVYANGDATGTLIGPYKLLEQIGEGGMGLVYMAEQQQPVRRLVALKLVKPGMDSKQVLARFEAERQALAMMDHPNIAKIYDAGTVGQASSLPEISDQRSEVNTDKVSASLTSDLRPLTSTAGRPYFAMELVRGIPINEFCEQQKLNVRQRLDLFFQVCHAIQHAHQKGIIHRDLKPTNVLVTKADTVALPKVIDFGIAKALGPALTDHTLHTGFAQLIGTPLYMSPEQAEMNHFGVDTRSDVYSLGVLLYELLTGTTPFDKETLHKAGFEEMRRIIREEEPETVSARIARTRTDKPGVDTGVNRRVHAATELDWIVMKALEKDRTRRYESASALAADIQRYLSDEPVLACPATAMYRFQKFARRHKPALATAAAIAVCLLLGSTVSAWQAVRATTAEAQAEANEQKANANANAAEQKEQEAIKQRDEVKALADKLVAKDQQLQRTLYAAHMNLAHNAFEAGAPARLRELLAQHRPQTGEPDLRGFEWHYLNRLLPADLLVLKHTGRVTSLAYSPDGKRLATISIPGGWQNGTLCVWDAQTGDKLFSHQGINGPTNVTFSPDGKLVTAQGKIWDSETGKELLSLSRGGGFGVAFNPDGKRLATGTSIVRPPASYIAIWDAQTGERLLTTSEGHSNQIRGIAFSPDGKRLVSASADKTIKLWDAETGQILHTLEGHTEAVFGVAYCSNGKRVASASSDKTVKLWDPLSGTEIRTLRGHTAVVLGVAFSPDGKRLASGSQDNTVKVWDVESGEELFALGGHTRPIWSVAFSPDGQRLASASEDGTVKVREAKAIQKALVLGGGPGDVTDVAFSPDGRRLTSVHPRAALDNDVTKAMVWDTQSGEKLLSIDAGGASLSLDGRRLKGFTAFRPPLARQARGSAGGETSVWDLLTGEKLHTIPNFRTSFPSKSTLSPDGHRLLITPSPGVGAAGVVGGAPLTPEIKVLDATTGQEIWSLKGQRVNLAFSPDCKRLAGISGGTLKVWDAETGKEILSFQGAASNLGFNEAVAFSSDGNRLVSGSDDAAVAKVWDAQTGEELLSLKGHSGAITRAAFSPDNKRIATTSSDATIKVWDSQTAQELLTLAGHSFRDNGVAFSPDGHHLAAGGPGGTVLIYDATPLPEKP